MITIDDVLLAARVKYPYLSHALYALTPVERPGLNTLAVDKFWRLYYDLEAINRWGLQTSVLIVAEHELAHLLRKHMTRCGDLIRRTWLIAADCEINDDIADLPAEGLLPRLYGMPDHLLSEQYYELLQEQEQEQEQEGEGKGKGGCTSCGGGSGAGVPLEHELDEATAPAVSPASQEAIIRGTAEAVAKHAGQAPAGLVRWATAQLAVRVPWETLLRRQLTGALLGGGRIAAGFTYCRPHRRRQSVGGVIVPAVAYASPRLALVIDTSGSVDADMLGVAVATAKQAMYSCPGAIVLDVDAAVGSVQRRTIRQLRGGGGTDMCVGITRACELKASVIVVITDGHTPWPDVPVAGVIAVILGDGPTPPTWIKEIRV